MTRVHDAICSLRSRSAANAIEFATAMDELAGEAGQVLEVFLDERRRPRTAGGVQHPETGPGSSFS